MIRGPHDTVFSVEKHTYIINKIHMRVDALYPDGLYGGCLDVNKCATNTVECNYGKFCVNEIGKEG